MKRLVRRNKLLILRGFLYPSEEIVVIPDFREIVVCPRFCADFVALRINLEYACAAV